MRFIVTAGPTREFLDPVRFLSNPSTGRMGFAVAAAAAKRGNSVTLISGPVTLPTPKGVRRIDIVSARDMLAAVMAELDSCRGHRVTLVSTAAVADWRPAKTATRKLKKSQMSGVLRLMRNPDILKTVRSRLKCERRTDVALVGFAAETNDVLSEAVRKCREKGLKFIVANDVTKSGCGFGTTTNQVTLVFPDGRIRAFGMMAKSRVAERIVDEALGA